MVLLFLLSCMQIITCHHGGCEQYSWGYGKTEPQIYGIKEALSEEIRI